jgi:hypothetical protein
MYSIISTRQQSRLEVHKAVPNQFVEEFLEIPIAPLRPSRCISSRFPVEKLCNVIISIKGSKGIARTIPLFHSLLLRCRELLVSHLLHSYAPLAHIFPRIMLRKQALNTLTFTVPKNRKVLPPSMNLADHNANGIRFVAQVRFDAAHRRPHQHTSRLWHRNCKMASAVVQRSRASRQDQQSPYS